MANLQPNATIFNVPFINVPFNKGTVFNTFSVGANSLTRGSYPVIQGSNVNTTFYYTIKSAGANPNPIVIPRQLVVSKNNSSDPNLFSEISYDPNGQDSIPTYVLIASPLDFESSTLPNKKFILLNFIAGDMNFMANNGFFTQVDINGVASKVYMCYRDKETFLMGLLTLEMNFNLTVSNNLKSKLTYQTGNRFNLESADPNPSSD